MPFDRHENDFGQTLQIVVTGFNMVGTTSATIDIKRPSGQVMSKTATVDIGAAQLTYVWVAADLVEPGVYSVQGVINKGAASQTRTNIGTIAVGSMR